MSFLKNSVVILSIFFLTSCNPIRFEYYNIVPESSNFYDQLLIDEVKIRPSFRPMSENILSESHATHSGPYMFSLYISNGINEKQRILKKVVPINIYLLENSEAKIAQNELSDLKIWRTSRLGNPLYPEDFTTEFYASLNLDIDWENLETIKVHVEFKAIFEEDGKESEKVFKKEIRFVPYHDIQDTTGFSRLVV
ncbi:hypothetical protein DID80_06760 [Candidatus Marinamargulisbacteria bacterium SCGC AAA071-K20]|nr:hypothetical protein DID80_06760 [Candidatus Marinamargulisbacteria bacterium SCGC AAA071-K20]